MVKHSAQRRSVRCLWLCLFLFFSSVILSLWIHDSSLGVASPVLSDSRLSSDPLITGDGFRSTCKLVLDERYPLSELSSFSQLLEKTLSFHNEVVSVFVKTDLIDKFIAYSLEPLAGRKDLTGRLLLISHNSDLSAPFKRHNMRNKNNDHDYSHQVRFILDNPRIVGWYSTNTAIEHPKLWPIPIGIENRNRAYGQHAVVYAEEFQNALSTTSEVWKARRLLFVAFGLSSYYKYRIKVRRQLMSAFAGLKNDVTFADLPNKHRRARLVREDAVRLYLRQLRAHRFVAAPRGNGMDTHRLWEALYMGCVPIVQRSAMDRRLLSGLPVLLVDSFAEVTPELLASPRATSLAQREEFQEAASSMLRMDYWRKKILNATRM